MAKVALLIGVSEYEPGLKPLPAAAKDVEAMQRVLLHQDIGGFDNVTLLINPQQYEMGEAIERLFDGRQRDDLVLLFFSISCTVPIYQLIVQRERFSFLN
ncbi:MULTISPECIES: caspase family protein [Nostoc]|uniref:Caspase family protein n=1 Tax=Nostoc paludosum FACHB-159 TaxID=2692908 RepID=A0ABR8KHZ4_9NOSO|nr:MULTISPECIES: caspase family protein [Nostoc]MBD2682818.1 caspase family protein [Nostoc sp. FACHB-857]MBD2739153.1 caspase family protein [Nostoc paludosum FACHB-159]